MSGDERVRVPEGSQTTKQEAADPQRMQDSDVCKWYKDAACEYISKWWIDIKSED